jgi:hypothetical protein
LVEEATRLETDEELSSSDSSVFMLSVLPKTLITGFFRNRWIDFPAFELLLCFIDIVLDLDKWWAEDFDPGLNELRPTNELLVFWRRKEIGEIDLVFKSFFTFRLKMYTAF